MLTYLASKMIQTAVFPIVEEDVVDGTLAGRMKGSAAENNVHAKTGTMTNVSSISGYLRTADGEMLAFAIAANNFIASRGLVESVQDSALIRLSGFSRK
jgi:D-alanyl-D-alanine carboxypeptidase/D-alanyl-D-alanine-endopeptidase (penicillin-binding protein 4)